MSNNLEGHELPPTLVEVVDSVVVTTPFSRPHLTPEGFNPRGLHRNAGPILECLGHLLQGPVSWPLIGPSVGLRNPNRVKRNRLLGLEMWEASHEDVQNRTELPESKPHGWEYKRQVEKKNSRRKSLACKEFFQPCYGSRDKLLFSYIRDGGMIWNKVEMRSQALWQVAIPKNFIVQMTSKHRLLIPMAILVPLKSGTPNVIWHHLPGQEGSIHTPCLDPGVFREVLLPSTSDCSNQQITIWCRKQDTK